MDAISQSASIGAISRARTPAIDPANESELIKSAPVGVEWVSELAPRIQETRRACNSAGRIAHLRRGCEFGAVQKRASGAFLNSSLTRVRSPG
jgi:hypothetical protein